MNSILAIDIGTSFTTSSFFKNGRPEIIEKIPSVIQYGFMGETIIGEKALERKTGNRENTVDGIKRFLGRSFKDIEKDLTKYTFGIFNDNNNILIDAFYKTETPENIISLLIKESKIRAEAKTGLSFNQVVLTTPASATSKQRLYLKNAAHKGGFNKVKIINEPTAAVLAYIISNGKNSEKLAVYNFGGGMFDFSIIDYKRPYLKIISTFGNSLLGGWDITDEMVKLILSKFRKNYGISLNLNQGLLLKAEFYTVAEEAVQELSKKDSTLINIQSVAKSENGEIIDLNLTIERSEFERQIYPIILKSIELAENAIKDSKIFRNEISRILLVGGCTQIPIVKRLLNDFYISQKNNDSFGFLKWKKSLNENTFDNNPQEIVALGAAIQAGIISGEVSNLNIQDIVTHSLGIKTHPDQFSKIIHRSTNLPISKNDVFTTVYNYQEDIEINILQGEKHKASENTSLGNFLLKDIEKAPAGVPKVKVIFTIDENGIFHVSANDIRTGVSKDMVIEQEVWKL